MLQASFFSKAPQQAGRNQALVLAKLKRFIAGEPLDSVVDLSGGYCY